MIIGFSGHIGTGKTTICNMLQNIVRVSSCRIAFGDALKDEAAAFYGFDKKLAYEGKNTIIRVEPGPLIPEAAVNPEWNGEASIRQILQFFGTEYVRTKLGPDYWVERLDRRVQEHYRMGTRLILIDDVRFKNEYDYVRARGLCFRLEHASKYRNVVGPGAHISETELDTAEFDHIFKPMFGEDYLRREAHIIAQYPALAFGNQKP